MSKWVYQADGFSPDEESCVLHETPNIDRRSQS